MSKYSFKKNQTLGFRVWHWINALVILGLLATVLLRKTLLSWRSNSVLIQEKLNAAGTTITADLAKEIAVAIRDPLWDWHIYLGYALSAFLIARLVAILFIEKNGAGLKAIKTLMQFKNIPASEKGEAFHYNIVKIGYLVFYAATILMVLTGLTLTFKTNIGISKDLAGLIKEVHELMMWYFVFFVVTHIAGVVFIENTRDKGIVSDLINGGSRRTGE